MATTIIDGRIVGAKLRHSAARRTVFETIIFQLPDGSRRTYRNLAAVPEIADALTPGTSGRFYLHSIAHRSGLHGLRTYDGRAMFGFVIGAETFMLVLGVLGLFLTGAVLLAGGEWAASTSLLSLFGLSAGLLLRRIRLAARERFDRDAGVAVHNGLINASV